MRQENMIQKTWIESKMMWRIAAPAMLTEISQFLIGFVTSAYVGHLGELELAAVSVVQNVIHDFAFGVKEWEVPWRHYVDKQ
ncbi:MATE efflux family protein [Euphorbia peplus]|nr:MATE efflux family protein [Euphorbia peplus]